MIEETEFEPNQLTKLVSGSNVEFSLPMPEPSIWPLLRGNKAEQDKGLEIAKVHFEAKPSPSRLMQLGVAYLWLHQYEMAWSHFHYATTNRKTAGDSEFGMAGVAKWCLGEYEKAISTWKDGLKAKYARAAGMPVRMPMLLFFASVARPGHFDRGLAEQLLVNVTKDERIGRWPGPVVRMLLGQLTETEFDTQRKARNQNDIFPKDAKGKLQDEREANYRDWQAVFYKIVFRQSASPDANFHHDMKAIAELVEKEADEDVFLSQIWSEEFCLARYEGWNNSTHV